MVRRIVLNNLFRQLSQLDGSGRNRDGSWQHPELNIHNAAMLLGILGHYVPLRQAEVACCLKCQLLVLLVLATCSLG